jgi:hypothetical protein
MDPRPKLPIAPQGFGQVKQTPIPKHRVRPPSIQVKRAQAASSLASIQNRAQPPSQPTIGVTAPPGVLGHLLLLPPFAFQRVLLARLLSAVAPRTRYYVGSDSSSPPDSRLLRSATRSVRAQAESCPGTVWQLTRRLPPPANGFTGSRPPVGLERGVEVSLHLLKVFPTAPPRTTLGFSRFGPLTCRPDRRLHPSRQAGLPPNALVTGSCDCSSAVCLRSSGPRLAATPYPVDYPAQERSTGARLSLARPP